MAPEVKSFPVLAISIDDGPRRVVSLGESVTTIGRSVDNVLEIPDPNMSRRHCVIEQRESGEVIITDCNSSNGTRVNEEPIISQELASGDEISCGSTLIRYAKNQAELAKLQGKPRRTTADLKVDPPERVSLKQSSHLHLPGVAALTDK